jgi:hypothetical protein
MSVHVLRTLTLPDTVPDVDGTLQNDSLGAPYLPNVRLFFCSANVMSVQGPRQSDWVGSGESGAREASPNHGWIGWNQPGNLSTNLASTTYHRERD